jgi:hypothetical protein
VFYLNVLLLSYDSNEDPSGHGHRQDRTRVMKKRKRKRKRKREYGNKRGIYVFSPMHHF